SGAKARCEIGDSLLGQKACERIEQLVADPARERRVRLARPRADDEIVLADLRHEACGVGWPVLAVAVGDQDARPGRDADAALHRRTVALGVRIPDDARSGVRGFRARAVTRSIVDDEDLVPRRGRLEVAD